VECKAISPCAPFLVAINVELMNPIEFTVALNNVRGVIQGGGENAWRFGDSFAAPVLGCSLSREMWF